MKKSKQPHRPERDMAIHQVLRAIRGIPAKDVAAKTFVSAGTITRWRQARTRYPHHLTLAAVARVAGLEFKLVPIDDKHVRPRKEKAADEAAARQAFP